MLPADSPFASLPAPGPHPATTELRAYAAGTLNPPDEHCVEAHALDCARCAELLAGFSMSDATTTDQALAGLRSRLQARVADDVTPPVLLPAGGLRWPRLAAAAALLGVAAGGLWGWQQQHPAVEVATAPSEAAAPATPAIKPQPASRAAIATAQLPQAATRPRPATATAATSRPADYAAVRPSGRAAGPGLLRRPAAPALADQPASASEAADDWASKATPATTETRKLAGRAATSSTVDAATSVAADEESMPQVALAAAPRPAAPAKAPALADSSAPRPQEAMASRFSEAKVAESAALVRDKSMPATMTIAPAPVVGTPALRAYLHQEAAKFELEEGAKSLNGMVRLRFIVGADGKLSNLQVVRGMRADYDEEALRLVCEGPAWRPGIAGGRRAALPVEITVSF